MSQPEFYGKRKYDEYDEYAEHAYSQDPYNMTEDTKELKRQQFRTFLNNQVEDVFKKGDVIKLDIPTTTGKHFYYFIGRLNPPHDGHIAALKELVDKATDSKPLILLGSGPGKLRTLDNPIPFSLKEAFINDKLVEMEIFPERYTTLEMDGPAGQVSNFILSSLKGTINYDEISITHVAGGKDEDTTKLAFALNAAERTAKSIMPKAKITTSTFAVEPKPSTSSYMEPMSATQVRKSVYRNYVLGKGFEDWDPQYKEFYGDMAENIYNAILEPALSLSTDQVIHYIETSELPKFTKRPRTTKKLGGNRKRITRKNKRQSKYRHNKSARRNKRRTFRKK